LRNLYGGFYTCMVTLFMVISSGIDWADAARPLENIHPSYLPIFMIYIFMMQFGVLNVIVGTFVATATDIASKDREAMVKVQISQMDTYTSKIRRFFIEADTDKSGTLSWEELRAHLGDRKVQAWFNSMDIDVSQAKVLYDLLDRDGSNQVTIDEFLEGCVRFKGQAKSIDLNMLILMTRRLMLDFKGVKLALDEEEEEYEEKEEEEFPAGNDDRGHLNPVRLTHSHALKAQSRALEGELI